MEQLVLHRKTIFGSFRNECFTLGTFRGHFLYFLHLAPSGFVNLKASGGLFKPYKIDNANAIDTNIHETPNNETMSDIAFFSSLLLKNTLKWCSC